MAGTQTETGLKGEYFRNTEFSGNAVTRLDPTIDFDWGTGGPMERFRKDNFTVRWTGSVQAEHSETYTFITTSDDGVRLWIDDRLLIDNWAVHAATEDTGTIDLVAGVPVSIKVEYFEAGGAAVMKLAWSSPSTPRQIVPTSRLSPLSSAELAELAKEAAEAEAAKEAVEAEAKSQTSASPSAAQSGGKPVLKGALSLVADTIIVPGTSLLVGGQYKAGALHAVAGIAARVIIGPIGWLAVAANSVSKSTTGKYIVGNNKDN